jgi:hypothetical protein
VSRAPGWNLTPNRRAHASARNERVDRSILPSTKETALQHLAGNRDFSGWVVAGLFALFLLSVAVYRVASLNAPEIEAAADSPSTPLPAGPRRHEPER